MKVGLLGLGSIGGFLARELDRVPSIEAILGYDVIPAKAEALRSLGKFRTEPAAGVIEHAHVVVEAASQEAVHEYAEKVLSRGKPLVVLSVGALADEPFTAKLLELCDARGGQLLIPSGAVGGLDALAAAKRAGLESVELETRKPPKTLGVDEKEEMVVFEGDAREAVRRFPATVNVAATISLAGLGAKKTRVKVVADPRLSGNVHIVRARGKHGALELRFENVAFPENPKTSMLAAYSALELLVKLGARLRVGT